MTLRFDRRLGIVCVRRQEWQNGWPSSTDQLQPIKVRLAHGTTDSNVSNANSFKLKASGVSHVGHCPSSKNVAVRQWGQSNCLMLILVQRSTATIDTFVRASMKFGAVWHGPCLPKRQMPLPGRRHHAHFVHA